MNSGIYYAHPNTYSVYENLFTNPYTHGGKKMHRIRLTFTPCLVLLSYSIVDRSFGQTEQEEWYPINKVETPDGLLEETSSIVNFSSTGQVYV